jgi:transposase
VAACLRTQLKKKEKEVFESLQGFFRDHHRVLLRPLLETIDFLEGRVKAVEERLDELMKDHRDLLERLEEIPGVGPIGAKGILAGVGTTLETFKTSGHLCSWAGLTGSHHESAGKRVKGRRGINSREHKSWMVELAWAAVKKKGTYYRDKYFRLKARRGPRRAIVAIARRMMEAIFHIVKNGASYRELGEDYLLRRNEQATYVRLMHQARRLV